MLPAPPCPHDMAGRTRAILAYVFAKAIPLQSVVLTCGMTGHTSAGSSPLNCCWVEGGCPGRTAALALWLTEATSCSRALMVFCTYTADLVYFRTLQ